MGGWIIKYKNENPKLKWIGSLSRWWDLSLEGSRDDPYPYWALMIGVDFMKKLSSISLQYYQCTCIGMRNEDASSRCKCKVFFKAQINQAKIMPMHFYFLSNWTISVSQPDNRNLRCEEIIYDWVKKIVKSGWKSIWER